MGPSLLTSSALTYACRKLSENQTWKVFGVEVLGINLPKTTLVRTKDEAIDVGVNEFGNTVGFFGGLWGGGHLMDNYLKTRGMKIMADPAVISQARAIKSFALVPLLVGFMGAMPFFRNAFTAWRSGTVDYKDLITRGRKADTAESRRRTQDAIRRFTDKGTLILGAGFGLAVLGVAFATSRSGWKALQTFPGFVKALSLTGEKATEFGDLRAVAFWGMPAYLGWMAASRDGFEIKEQFLKMLNFIGVYVLTDKVVDQFFKAKSVALAQVSKANNWGLYAGDLKNPTFVYKALAQFKNKIPAEAAKMVRLENLRTVSGFGLTVALMAALPAVLNMVLTRGRLARAEAESRQNAWTQQLAIQNHLRNMALEKASVSG